MASGINNIHQPGTCNGSKAARSSSAEECSREMHMKMCKKIAQLTKAVAENIVCVHKLPSTQFPRGGCSPSLGVAFVADDGRLALNRSNYRATIMRRASAPRRRGVRLGAVERD